MSHSIIHHDCIIEDNTIICSNVSVAGHVRIMNGAYLGKIHLFINFKLLDHTLF